MWSLSNQQNMVPEEFQDRLDQAGGFNRYGESNFKIMWGQALFFRAGGTWEIETAPYTGYRWLRLVDEPAWVILMWVPPETESTPEAYYVANYDQDSGLQTLGEYPYNGKYEIVSVLRHTEIVNGKLEVHTMPLSSILVDLVIPTIIEAKDMSIIKRKAIYLERKAKEDEEQTKAIAESLEKGRLAFGSSPVSYAGQICKTMGYEERAMRLKRNMNKAIDMARHLGQGIYTK